MPTFKIKHVEKYMVSIYQVEAETKEEASYKYEEELAGSLEAQEQYYDSNEDKDYFVLLGMTSEEIAKKYVYGKHTALTDRQEVKDMITDIENYVEEKLILWQKGNLAEETSTKDVCGKQDELTDSQEDLPPHAVTIAKFTKVKHSESKSAWNVIDTEAGNTYKIARIPYNFVGDNEILTTQNKFWALERARFIDWCFRNSDKLPY
jgi:hypothetical protein